MAKKTVKRSLPVKRARGGTFAAGTAPGPGRPARVSDALLHEIARARPTVGDVRALELLENPAELGSAVRGLPPALRERVRRLIRLSDLAERALERRLAVAAGESRRG